MTEQDRYAQIKDGGWRLQVSPERWSEELWRRVLVLIGSQSAHRHPQTMELAPAGSAADEVLYLKVFHPSSGAAALKDAFRRSRAIRFLRQSVFLRAAGFFVPQVIAAGEERAGRSLKRAFVLTVKVPGETAPLFLRDRYQSAGALPVRQKRVALEFLGGEVRRLHDAGFVHGDLVPSNIVIAPAHDGGFRFYFMDHDRTRRYPKWLCHRFWRRNLVQLNRIPLPGITLQDRMRFFRAYWGRRDWDSAGRALLSWVERKTRQRRRECDAVDSTGSFRRLMTWKSERAASV